MTRGAASYFFMRTIHRTLLLLLALWLILGNIPANGQAYFNKRYANLNTGSQLGFVSAIENDSGYVAYGTAINYPSVGLQALALYFLNPDGEVRRTRHYIMEGANSAFAGSLHQLPDGGYVFAAQSISQVFPFPGSTVLLRVSAIGDTLWTRRWQRNRGEDALSMCVLHDGGFAIVGSVAVGASSSDGVDFVLTRTDANGNTLWWQTYDYLFRDVCYSIVPTPDGGFLLGGLSYDQQRYQSFLVKTDSLGGEQWRRTFGSVAFDYGVASVAALHDGSYAVGIPTGTGGTPGPLARLRSIIYKLDAQGQTIWQRACGPSRQSSEIYALHELPDGSLVAAGQQVDDTAPLMPEGTVFKLCPDGDSLWFRTYKILAGPNSHNYLSDLRPTSDGGFVAAGYLFANPPDTGSSDGWVFRLDSAGHLLAGGPPVARRCQLVGVDAPQAAGTGVEVWPNPATDGYFTLHLPQKAGPASLTLADAHGRTVWSGQASGTQSGTTRLDLSRYPAGLYLLRVGWPDGRTSHHRLARP